VCSKDPQSKEIQLLARCKAGDKEQFQTLLSPYLHMLRLITYSILQNKEDMEEVVQESVLKAITHIGQLRDDDSFKTWLLQIAANEARMRQRKYRKHLFDSVEHDIHEQPFQPRQFIEWRKIPSTELEQKELRDSLTNALNCLGEGYREVFVLRDVENLSTIETGKILGMSEAAVNTRLHRARLQMREYLTPFFKRPGRRWVPMSFKMMVLMGKMMVRKVISCKRAMGEISNYINGCLSEELRAQIEEHLQLCERCSLVLDTTRNLLHIVGDDKVFDLPFECTQDWQQFLEKRPGKISPIGTA